MNISIIICSYNRADFIIGAVQSLVDQDFPKEKFEIIIVDNNSTDDTETICQKYIHQHKEYTIYFIKETKQGSSFARNAGAQIAKGALYIFIDDDAQAHPGFLINAWNFYQNHIDTKGFGGKIIPKFNPQEPEWMSPLVASLVGRFDYGDTITPFAKGKYPLESNMAVDAIAYHEINGFNTDLPGVKGTLRIGGEGKDLFNRLSEKYGAIYYVPDMVVDHIVDTIKLTPEYMYRVASGIGRGEKIRIDQTFRAKILKFIEYIYKLGGSIVIAAYYIVCLKPKKAWPLIKFRLDVLKGFVE